MARIRTIKPEFWTSEQVMECSPIARLLFVGMLNFCDDGGNHPASPRRLKAEVFPSDDITTTEVEGLVSELVNSGLVSEYSYEDKHYWHVTGWHHQKIEKPTYKYPPYKTPQVVGDKSESGRRGLGDTSPPEGKGSGREEVNNLQESPSTTTTPPPPVDPPPSSSSDPADRAKALAGMLNNREKLRGKKANAYGTDSRIQAWVRAGVTDEQFREAYDIALTQREDSGEAAAAINVGFLDVFIAALLNPAAKASSVTAIEKAWHETAKGIEEKGRELGIEGPDPLTGGFPAFKARVFKAAGIAIGEAA